MMKCCSRYKWSLSFLFIFVICLVLGRNNTYVLVSGFISLITYSLIRWYEWTYLDLKKKSVVTMVKIFSLMIVTSTVTVFKAWDYIRPEFVMSEVVSLDKGNAFFHPERKNPYFLTQKDILEPINLKIKDTYYNLAYKVDYDVLRNRRVFVNYRFGEQDITNEAIMNRGLVFTYKTRALYNDPEYKKFQEREIELRLLDKSLEKNL